MSTRSIYDKLMSAINNKYGVCGLMGNLYAESGLRSNNLQNTSEKKLDLSDTEYTAKVDDGSYTNFVHDSAGYGLAQWTYWSRKQNLLDYARKVGKSIGDEDMQVDFLINEIKGYKTTLDALVNAKSIKDASDAVLTQYERPADQSDAVKNKRAEYGKNIYNEIMKGETDIMAKKVFLGVGHGGSDPGAVKYIKEADVNLAMAKACRDYLVAHGVDVKMSRTVDENDPLTEEIAECNSYCPDLAVDIHNNAGGGDGFEVYHYHKGGTSKTLAQNIEAEVLKIGQNSRGLKTKLNSSGTDYYGFIRCINAPSIICEGVFVDNKADASQADEASEWNAFGVAYAKGILKTLGIAYDSNVQPDKSDDKPADANKNFPATPFMVRVLVSDLNIRKQPKMGDNVIGQTGKGSFTIVKVSDGWGLLKSYADKENGWIYLENPEYVSIAGTVTTKPSAPKTYKDGDVIKLKAGSTYYNGKAIPAWVFNCTLYYRGKNENGIIFSTLKTGAITGVVKESAIK